MRKFLSCLAAAFIILTVSWTGLVQAEVKEYKIPCISDFSGPFAPVMKYWHDYRAAVLKWWSDTEGKKLGIKLTPKPYDTRYDSTQMASMWPGILADDKPIFVLGMGATDQIAVLKRLPDDKVPFVYGTSSYLHNWIPNSWTIQTRPTSIHEIAATIDYLIKAKGLKPFKLGIMTFQGSPGTLEVVKGAEVLFKTMYEPKGLGQIVSTQWIDFQPVDVTNQTQALIDAKANLVIGLGTPSMLMAFVRAREVLGNYDLATVSYTYHGLHMMGQKTGNWKQFENIYVMSGHIASLKKEGKAFEFFKMLQKDYGLEAGDWDPIGLTGLSQGILAVRGIERAVKKVGAANLTGQAVYEALSTASYTEEELMGIMPALSYTAEAPFPKEPKVMLEVVKDGKYQLASPDWLPVPAGVQKW